MPLRAPGSLRDARVLSFLPPSAEPIDSQPVGPMRIRQCAPLRDRRVRGVLASVRDRAPAWGFGDFCARLPAVRHEPRQAVAAPAIQWGLYATSETVMSHSTRMRL